MLELNNHTSLTMALLSLNSRLLRFFFIFLYRKSANKACAILKLFIICFITLLISCFSSCFFRSRVAFSNILVKNLELFNSLIFSKWCLHLLCIISLVRTKYYFTCNISKFGFFLIPFHFCWWWWFSTLMNSQKKSNRMLASSSWCTKIWVLKLCYFTSFFIDMRYYRIFFAINKVFRKY